jgi:deoxyribodipyrimidine photo-lyase
VFTPYWRRWVEVAHREPEPAPARVPTPATMRAGAIPALDELTDGEPAPELMPGGESAGRARADWWFDAVIEDYDEGRSDLAHDRTSKLSPHLHLGTLSVAELVARIDRRRRAHETFLRELAWRDFNHQLVAARPDLVREDYRSRGDRWRDDPDAFTAWREGGPATRWSTPGCASSSAKAGCTTAPG